MKDKPLYKCDPLKNKECSKTCCKFNPDAIERVCETTTKKEYSMDGIIIISPPAL